ncbi:MAG: acyl-CoA thioester hydrolase [Planctomycetota bacterium]|jgi:acyl-CoA thioester hydrolase
MVHEYKTSRRVEFADTDMAGIAHFSNFFRYMEATEHEFFRVHGLSLHGHGPDKMFGWVRVKATCNYLTPARYQELLEITLLVVEKSSRKLRYEFTFRVIDEAASSDSKHTTGPPIAKGELVVVHVIRPEGEDAMRSADMPAEVADLIQVTPSATTTP